MTRTKQRRAAGLLLSLCLWGFEKGRSHAVDAAFHIYLVLLRPVNEKDSSHGGLRVVHHRAF